LVQKIVKNTGFQRYWACIKIHERIRFKSSWIDSFVALGGGEIKAANAWHNWI